MKPITKSVTYSWLSGNNDDWHYLSANQYIIGDMNKSEKLAYRLSQILSRLHAGEKLSLIDLQQEFGVHERTVLRDFSRLAFLPIEREDGYYFLKQLDHRNPKAHLALNSLSSMGVDKLFPDRAVMTQALSQDTIYSVPSFTYRRFQSLSDNITCHCERYSSAKHSNLNVSASSLSSDWALPTH